MKKYFIALTSFLFVANAIGQENEQKEKDTIKSLNEVTVTSNYKYAREKSTTVSKMPLKNIENPQVYNVVTNELLKEQVVTNLNDGLKNATGITRLWESTGRNGDGAEFYSMRGFSVQPSMVNGLPALTNGNVDPINIDNIEVIKGPSGTLFGSSVISYGGLINLVTKKPNKKFGGEISYNSGTYGMDRITADINIPVKENLAVRINSAYQNTESFQDAGYSNSFFIAPSIRYEINDKLTFLINTEIYNTTSAKPAMLFLSRYSPLSFTGMELFDRNYKKSFTSNDLTIDNQSFNMQAQALYKLSNNWTSQTVLSRSTTKTNGYYQYLWDMADGDNFVRYIAFANGTNYTTDLQQNFIGDFKIGSLRNRLVVGLDYYNTDIKNGGSGWVTNGMVSLVNDTDTGDLTQAGTDALLVGTYTGNTKATQKIFSVYFSDVLNITDRLSVMASLRFDNFGEKTSNNNDDEAKDQTAFSPKFGAVYQIIENKVSVFGNYMNGFKNITPQSIYDTGGNLVEIKQFDPEHANQYEFGIKTNLYKDIISATISYYNINVKDKVTSNPNNINDVIQGGEVESKGIEVSFTATPTKGLSIIAGFSNNKSEVTKDYFPDNGYLGLRPEEAGPETLINFWANYKISNGSLKGFGIGFGGNYASEYKTLNRSNIGTFELPSYTILNSALSYDANDFNITLKLNNALNEKYYSGWSTVTPQQLRSVIAGLTYKF